MKNKSKNSKKNKFLQKTINELKKSKEKTLEVAKNIATSLPNIKKYASYSLFLVLLALMVVVVSVKSSDLEAYALRTYVGAKSFRITQPGVGWGTGFAVKAPSGQSYILTNDHVCEMSKDQKELIVVDDKGNQMPRRIMQRSDFTDLCLLEGMPGVEGLELAGSEPNNGDTIAAVGHPATYLVTMTKGEMIMKDDVEIPVGLIKIENEYGSSENGDTTKEQCSLPKNKIVTQDVESLFGKFKVTYCLVVTKKAYFTNILSQPGSSGSPVVNFWGNIVGVLFAGDRAGWSILVSLNDVKKFIKMY